MINVKIIFKQKIDSLDKNIQNELFSKINIISNNNDLVLSKDKKEILLLDNIKKKRICYTIFLDS